MTPEEIIEKGIENIEKYGHIKGTYGAENVGFCAVGSMRYALAEVSYALAEVSTRIPIPGRYGVSDSDAKAYQVALELLEAEVKAAGWEIQSEVVGSVIPLFNDDNGTTTEDVILMMKKAAHRDC